MSTITVNGNSFDPVAQRPALVGRKLDAADSSQSDYILVQTRGPLSKAQKQQLKDAHVDIIEYVPDDSYIARYEPSDLTPLRQLAFVSWAGVYPQELKIEPVLASPRAGRPTRRVRNVLTAAPLAIDAAEQTTRAVEIVLHSKADAEKARRDVARAAGLDPSKVRVTGRKIRLTVSPRTLELLAKIDGVRHIEEFSGAKLYNNVAGTLIHADGVQSATTGLLGDGEIVAVCDTGFDTGMLGNVHPAFTGRVLKFYPLARPNASDPDGHGTHVCGSAVGDGALSDGTPIRGTAPKANLIVQSAMALGGQLNLPENLADLFSAPYNNDGARVHCDSWGDTVADSSYSEQSREVDDFVWNHRDAVICFAAGNEAADQGGTGSITPGSIGPPGTAKNCITVGSSESNRPTLKLTYKQLDQTRFPVDPIASDCIADNPQGVAAFSGRGPTRDQRVKPDLVCPGCAILSAKSRLVVASNKWGDSPDPAHYVFNTGTSMANGLVAGSAAVVRQSFRIRQNVKPSAALVKAMLINGAVPLKGQYTPLELSAIPNVAEGFGLLHMGLSLAPAAADTSIAFWDEGAALDVGDENHFTFQVGQTATGLKVTLVWTDPPGEALQNDLDLAVSTTIGGATVEWHGNQPADSAGFDRVNNVEQVQWDGISPGAVTITVRAFRITASPQSYALVARSS